MARDPETDLAKDRIRRTEAMKAGRSTTNVMWQEIRDNIIPAVARFIGREPEGVKQGFFLVDETPEQAHDLLTAAIVGMICNPALKWAEYYCPDDRVREHEEAAGWFALATKIVFETIYQPKCGLAVAHFEAVGDWCGFGTGYLFSGWKPGFGPRFQARALQETYHAEGADGIDTFHRCFQKSAAAAAGEWGIKNLPEPIAKAAMEPGRQDEKFEFLHCIGPRAGGDHRALDPKKLPIESVYIALDHKAVVNHSGYADNPMTAARWMTRSGETYGRGAGAKALPTSKMIHRGLTHTIESVELGMEPPLMAPDDGIMSPIRQHRGGITMVRADLMMNGQEPIRPINTGVRPELAKEFLPEARQRVERTFLNHLLQSTQDPRMTATQFIQIAEETVRLLGPMLSRGQNEMLGPSMMTTFWNFYRAGAFPPPPPILARALALRQVAVRLTSPVMQQQRLSEAKAVVQYFGVLTQVAQIDPGVRHDLKTDDAMRFIGEMFGVPANLIPTREEVAAARKADADAQQQQQEIANLRLGAGAVKDASAALPNLRTGLGLDQADASNASAAL